MGPVKSVYQLMLVFKSEEAIPECSFVVSVLITPDAFQRLCFPDDINGTFSPLLFQRIHLAAICNFEKLNLGLGPSLKCAYSFRNYKWKPNGFVEPLFAHYKKGLKKRFPLYKSLNQSSTVKPEIFHTLAKCGVFCIVLSEEKFFVAEVCKIVTKRLKQAAHETSQGTDYLFNCLAFQFSCRREETIFSSFN